MPRRIPDPGFHDEDRKVLIQLEIYVKNINEQLDKLQTRAEVLDQHKADRVEVIEVEKRILDRVDMIQAQIEEVDKSKASRLELPTAVVTTQEGRIKALEMLTYTLPEMSKTVSNLRDFRIKTVGYTAGACAALMLIGWMIQISLRIGGQIVAPH